MKTHLKLEKKNKYFYLLAANIYNGMTAFDKSAAVYEMMIKEIKGTEEYLYELAAVYQYANKPEEAIKTYNRADLEVNVGGEATKSGTALPELARLADHVVARCPHLALRGVMTVPPYDPDPERSRPHFAALREAAERVSADAGPAPARAVDGHERGLRGGGRGGRDRGSARSHRVRRPSPADVTLVTALFST